MTSFSQPQKITQMQCNQTNTSIKMQFLTWICQCFKYKPEFLNKMHHQIEGLINYADFKYSISLGKPQPGDFLQNIQFIPLSTNQKRLWLILSVILPYVIKRLVQYTISHENPVLQKIGSILLKIMKIITILQFINYGIFILKGQYRTISQRFLNIKMKFINPQNKRILNFSLMNRMLVWQIYELFLKTVLPHIFSFVSGPMKNLFYLSSYLGADKSQEKTNCVFCTSKNPVMTQQAFPCKHKACYYCCKSNKAQKCPFCSQPIQKWAPLRH